MLNAALAAGAAPVGRVPAGPAAGGGPRLRFDLPAQPLHEALAAFGAQTGFAGIHSAEATQGRWSAAVSGWLTPEAALRQLIDGSGLAVHFTAADAFVLEPMPADARPPAVAAAGPGGLDGVLQVRVREAFCAVPALAARDYRAAFSLRIAGSGQVHDARLLDTTGDAARDALLLSTLQGVRVDGVAADPSRAFVMLVTPRAAGSNLPCTWH